MNSNTTIVSEPMTLSKEDLADEYDKLSIAYKNEKRNNETYQQTIYKLKLDHQTALNAENFLSTELDVIQSTHTAAYKELTVRHELELESVRKRYADAMERCLSQEAELAAAKTTIDTLRKHISDQQNNVSRQSLNRQTSQSVEFLLDTVNKLEKDNFDVKCSESILRDQMESIVIANEGHEAEIVRLQEECACLAETLATKRSDLEEKENQCDAMQEKICALSCELASLKTVSDASGKCAEAKPKSQPIKCIL